MPRFVLLVTLSLAAAARAQTDGGTLVPHAVPVAPSFARTGPGSTPDAGTRPPEAPTAPGPDPHSVLGATMVRIDGCLAAPRDQGPRAAARAFPPKARADGEVHLERLGEGIRVTHDLSHACCLRANVQTSVEGSALHVVETLEGEPCACRCGSTIETLSNVPSGIDHIMVELARPGADRRASFEASLNADEAAPTQKR